MSSAQEKVLIALTVALLMDIYTRFFNNLLPSLLARFMGLINH